MKSELFILGSWMGIIKINVGTQMSVYTKSCLRMSHQEQCLIMSVKHGI